MAKSGEMEREGKGREPKGRQERGGEARGHPGVVALGLTKWWLGLDLGWLGQI